MKLLILAAAILAPPCYAVENQALFDAAVQRRKDRQTWARAIHRQWNAQQVYRYIPISVPVAVAPMPMIQQGWLQPPPVYYREPVCEVVIDYGY